MSRILQGSGSAATSSDSSATSTSRREGLLEGSREIAGGTGRMSDSIRMAGEFQELTVASLEQRSKLLSELADAANRGELLLEGDPLPV